MINDSNFVFRYYPKSGDPFWKVCHNGKVTIGNFFNKRSALEALKELQDESRDIYDWI